MNKNIKVAKELIKLAKQLTAVNPGENISDVSYYSIIKLEMQEFLKALDKYLKLRSYFFRAINLNDTEELIKIKGKIANVLLENSKFKNLSTNQLVDKVNESLSQAHDKLNGSTPDASELSFQRYIGSLIETKKTFLYAKKVNEESKIIIEDNAEYLMSKIAHILHNQRQLLIHSQNGKAVTDELIMLYDFLNERGIQLVTSLSDLAGDKNYADNALFHVNVEQAKNNSEFRVRIKEEYKNLIGFSNLLASFEGTLKSWIEDEEIKNERFTLVRRIGESISACQEMMMGYFTTINTLTLSAMKFNRKNKKLIELDKDIPQKTFPQYSEIQTISGINLDKMKELLREHSTLGWKSIKKDLSIIFDDQDEYAKLTEDQKEVLLKKLDKLRTELKKQNTKENKTSSDNNIINAGLIDNVKNFLQSAIDKIKDITFNVKKAFVNFLKKFNTKIDAIEKDLNKLDIIIKEDNKLTKQQIDMMKRINEMDQSLINLFDEIKNK